MQKRAEITWIVLGFAALAVAYTFPLILNLGSHLPNDLGDPLLSTWTLARPWEAGAIGDPCANGAVHIAPLSLSITTA